MTVAVWEASAEQPTGTEMGLSGKRTTMSRWCSLIPLPVLTRLKLWHFCAAADNGNSWRGSARGWAVAKEAVDGRTCHSCSVRFSPLTDSVVGGT